MRTPHVKMNVFGDGSVVVLLQINYTCVPQCYAYVVPIERLGDILSFGM